LGNLDAALNTYAEAGLTNYESEELAGTLINIREEVAKLPQAYSEVWDVFRVISNKNDPEAYEELLFDDELRI
jgi:type I restriction enzyme R subunit